MLEFQRYQRYVLVHPLCRHSGGLQSFHSIHSPCRRTCRFPMMFNTTLMSSKTYTFLKGQDNKKSSVTVFLKTPVQFPDNWISGFMRPRLLKVSQRYAQVTSQGVLISYVDLCKYRSISKFDNQTMNRWNNKDTAMLLVAVELTATLLHLFLPSEYHSLMFNMLLIAALSTYYDPHQPCSIDETNIHPFSHLLW